MQHIRTHTGTAAPGGPSAEAAEARVLWRRPHRRVIIKSIMATQKSMLHEMKWDQRYAVSAIEEVLTPALILYP